MSLFIILTFITFLNAYLNRFVSLVLKLIPQDSLIKSLKNEIGVLEKELRKISMVHEFAKYVKIQRKVNKLKEEKKELVKNNSFKRMKIKYALITSSYLIIVGSLIMITWFYRSEPVVKVPEQWLWPVSSFFDWSSFTPGFITVPCWIAISSAASKVVAEHF